MKNFIIVDKKTGEAVDLLKIDKKEIEKQINAMTENQVTDNFIQLKLLAKFFSKLEDLIKIRVKNETKEELEEEDETLFGNIKVKRIFSTRFDEKKLLTDGDDYDKYEWERLKNKYSKASSYIKIS